MGGEGIFSGVSVGERVSSLSEDSSGSSSQDSMMGTFFFLVECFGMVWLERERCVRPSASSRRVLVWGEDWENKWGEPLEADLFMVGECESCGEEGIGAELSGAELKP